MVKIKHIIPKNFEINKTINVKNPAMAKNR